MKRSLIIFALLGGEILAAENTVPTAFPAERYAATAEKSPFALATPAAPPPPPPQASFAANWYLTGLGRDPDGHDFVTIKAQDGSVHFSLTSGEENPDRVSLASVDWSDTLRKSTAIIKKGTETAKLIFSQEEAVPAPQPGGGRGARSGSPPGVLLPPVPASPVPVTGGPGLGGGSAQPGQPGQARTFLPRPANAPVITQPAMPQPNPAPVVGNPPVAEPSADPGNRRRIRTIAAPR